MNAIVTLLYDPSYLPGALALGISLRAILEQRPEAITNLSLGVLIDTAQFTSAQLLLLLEYYDELVEVKPLESALVHKLTHDLHRPELHKTFTKILLWNLDFDKVLYLDADTLPVVPATRDQGTVLDLFGLEFPHNKVLAAPDSGFPDVFNSGMMLLRPNTYDFDALAQIVQESASDPSVSFDGADQGLLNQYFNANPDWVRHATIAGGSVATAPRFSNWVKLPFLYNVTPSAQYQYLPAFKHFGGLDEGPAGPGLPGGSPGDALESSVASANDAISRYGAAALSFIGKSQIKLVHYIGPHKPWKRASSPQDEWWRVWASRFGSKSVDEVIWAPDAGARKPAVHHLSQQPERQPKYHSNPQPEPQHQDATPADAFGPSALLDPHNYRGFESVGVSEESSWNPAKEEPPSSSTHQVNQDMIEGMKAFANSWDEPVAAEPAESTPVAASEQEPSYSGEPPPQDTHGNSLYEYVQPERVFEGSEYFPKHKLHELAKEEPAKDEEPKKVPAVDPAAATSPETPTLGVLNNVADKLSGLYVDDEDVAPQEDAHDAAVDVEDEERPPKLFPWEFRSTSGPERVFD